MPIRMIAAALLVSSALIPAFAQVAPPAPQPPVSQPPATDPNAGEPTGTVPSAATEMQPADPSVPPNPSAPVGSAANPVVVGGNVTAPPATPTNYPKCSKTIRDSCVNPGEAKRGKR